MDSLSLKKLLRSKATLGVLMVAIGFLSFSLTNLVLRHWRLRSEIKALEAKAETMQQESFKTKELIEYLSSRGFNEKEARLKFNMLAPDEKVAVVIGEPVQNKKEERKIKQSNFRKWVDYFFGDKNK